jgi:hypothetical protein
MLMDNLPKKSMWYAHNSQIFTAWKICQIRNHSDFKYFFVFFDSYFLFRQVTDVHIQFFEATGLESYSARVTQVSRKRAPDLPWFSRYSLFGPLHFSSSVYILARLYLSNFSTAGVSLLPKCWAVVDCTAEYVEKKSSLSDGDFILAKKRRQRMTLLVRRRVFK